MTVAQPISRLDAARHAVRQFSRRTSLQLEAVTELIQADGRWEVELQVVEVHRIPGAMDSLATYRALLDGNGTLLNYDRTQTFTRGPDIPPDIR